MSRTGEGTSRGRPHDSDNIQAQGNPPGPKLPRPGSRQDPLITSASESYPVSSAARSRVPTRYHGPRQLGQECHRVKSNSVQKRTTARPSSVSDRDAVVSRPPPSSWKYGAL
ncbi:hypothetical protein MRB53_006249 [Persea americana]|uniref:Uncharacterized protein n=1 Tax=Persea americana TaxID=3435 RepID=A0ACC2MFF5_PERAE|nr:hypothetical protein MRB53_006249 [Persea americana]